jgi:hypothetical protein
MCQLCNYAKESKLLYTKFSTCPEDYRLVLLACTIGIETKCVKRMEYWKSEDILKLFYPAIGNSTLP